MARSDRWLKDLEANEQLGQEIMELINERNSVERSGSRSVRLQSSIRSKLQEFSNNIKFLKDGLIRESNLITTLEAERRQNKIDALISKEKLIDQAFKRNPEINEFSRGGLLNQGYAMEGSNAWGSSVLDNRHDDITPDIFRQKQDQIIQEQDKGLEALSKVIQRQKLMGHAIGDEIDYQNELIDDITDGVDRTKQKLVRTEHHVKKVHKKSGSCALIVVVILLFVVIIVVSVVPK